MKVCLAFEEHYPTKTGFKQIPTSGKSSGREQWHSLQREQKGHPTSPFLFAYCGTHGII